MLQSIGMGHFEIAGQDIFVHDSPLVFLKDDDAAVEVNGRCAVGEGCQLLIRSTKSLILPTTSLQFLLAARPTNEPCGVAIDRVVELVYERLVVVRHHPELACAARAVHGRAGGAGVAAPQPRLAQVVPCLAGGSSTQRDVERVAGWYRVKSGSDGALVAKLLLCESEEGVKYMRRPRVHPHPSVPKTNLKNA